MSRIVTDTSDCEAIVRDLMLAGQPIGLGTQSSGPIKTGRFIFSEGLNI